MLLFAVCLQLLFVLVLLFVIIVCSCFVVVAAPDAEKSRFSWENKNRNKKAVMKAQILKDQRHTTEVTY